jgi:hypothetical protein
MALPEYNRTILRQVQETDMSEANVWAALAQTMDNFSAQMGSVARTAQAKKAQQAATAKADYRWQLGQDQAQAARDLAAEKYAKSQTDAATSRKLTAEKYEKSQADAKAARDLAAEKYKKSQSDSDKAKLLAAEKYLKSQQDAAAARELTADKYAATLARQKESDEIAAATRARQEAERATADFVNAKESDVMTTLSQLSIDHANDYDGYIAAANELKKTWLDNDELDNTVGMRLAFETLIDNKIQQYGAAPYEAVAADNIEKSRAIAEQNIDDFVTDAVHEMSQFIDDVSSGKLVELSELDDFYYQQLDKVAGKYLTLEAKLAELIKNNNYSAEEVIELQDAMELNFFSGVITSQINNEMKNDNGWNAIDEFEEDPAKFISSRPHLQALIPKGVKISDEMATIIYEDIFKHYKDTIQQEDYLQTQVEAEDAKRHSTNLSETLLALAQGDVMVTKDFVADLRRQNDISPEGHDTLIYAITSDKYAQDNALVVWNLNKEIVDPKSNFAAREKAITEALRDGDIGVNTAVAFLTKIVEADKVTNKPYFQIGWDAIEKGLLKNPDDWSDANGQVLNFAQQEYYNRVQGYTDDNNVYHEPENGQDIYNDIIEKYKPMMAGELEVTEVLDYPSNIDTTIGASFATMEFNKSTGWNTFFIGTPDAPMAVETQIKIAELVFDKKITDADADVLLLQLEKYMKKHLGLD